MIRLNLSNCKGFTSHRSGWSYCINSLLPLHSRSGVFVDDFIERSFSWHLHYYYKKNEYQLPYNKEWIGFIHNPPNIPDWFDFNHSPQAILNRKIFQESLKHCRALVTLSEYLRQWLAPQVCVPVISVKHPTEKPYTFWTPESFFTQNKIPVVQLGYWLRKMNSIYELNTGKRYKKIWLRSDSEYAPYMKSIEHKTQSIHSEGNYKNSSVELPEHLTNRDYDNLMCRCVVFLDLYDSSANNAIVESIARNTPILVNKIPAVVEYLGEDYPFYFNTTEEASQKLIDNNLILETHSYLKNMNKEWLSGKYFSMILADKLTGLL